MYVRRLPQKQKGRKAVVREGEWEVLSSMGQRFLLLMGGNCGETKESGLLTRYGPCFYMERFADVRMCVRMHIDMVSSVAWSGLEELFQSLVLLGSLCQDGWNIPLVLFEWIVYELQSMMLEVLLTGFN